MRFDTIHETSVADIAAYIKDGLNVVKGAIPTRTGVSYSSSLTKATKGLVMEFPVLVSKANHIESAGIVAKAYEAKFVTLLQLAFAASNITNAKEGIDFVKNFHTNLNDKMSVDDFIDIMDHYVKESSINADSYAQFKAVTEDMKNLSYYFGEDINETALSNYKVLNNYGSLKVVKEADNDELLRKYQQQIANLSQAEEHLATQLHYAIDLQDRAAEIRYRELHSGVVKQLNDLQERIRNNNTLGDPNFELNKKKIDAQIDQINAQIKHLDDEFELSKKKDEREEDKLKLDKERNERDKSKQDLDMMATRQNMINNNIISSDLKKANELVPTMMVVNFVYQEEGSSTPAIMRQMIIGIKAKLYEVEPMDVINKILTKYTDSNVLLKLIQVNTRQISFVKDFLLAIDDAKLDALSSTKRGSTNKLFKVLERRALKGKIRKNLNIKNLSKAITSLVISQEEVEELLKHNIDVTNPKVIRPIMEKLNLISFAIIDESSESVKFIYDTGDDVFETIPLNKLEREQKDGMSKKVINLMAKMNR